ncbi:MAG: T9SS type A sorting domain-containing protein [Chitinispirillaceae bacterium]|nr:T9SS type A sorting domain-containing protein [Chitinispirillaceae bacterium]
MKRFIQLLPVILCLGSGSVGGQSITNYTTAKTIYDFESFGSVVWVGTSGGFYIHDLATGDTYLRPANAEFPDPSVRALAYDGKGNMWIGSHEGYLMRRDGEGNEYINSSYAAADWRISDLVMHGKYLIVASDKGVSLFDTEKRIAVKNAQHFSTFASSQVHTITTYKNRLYVGGESGSAVFKVTLDKLSDANMYDPSLWDIDTSVAPVHSFYEENGKMLPSTGISGRLFGYLLTTDSNRVTIHKDEPVTITLKDPGVVTAIKTVDAYRTLIGTEENYFWLWDTSATQLTQIMIPGPSFAAANRVHVDRNGKLWVLPYGITSIQWYPMPWWLGINEFDGSTWKIYCPQSELYFAMGHMMWSTEARAIVESDDGKMWFGFNGGAIKCFNPDNNEWWHYCNFGQLGHGEFVKRQGPCPGMDWGKCDAIAQDSSGYMWFGSWNNLDGCLLCYKWSPDENEELEGRYRRFPPKGVVDKDITINDIAVDRENNILFGTKEGILTIARHNGDPIDDGITIVKEFRNLQNIYQIVVLSDGTSLVLTAGGVMLFDPADKTLSTLEEFENGITRLTVENDNLFWYTVANQGVVRFDLLNNKKTVYDRAQGLIANSVNDIIVDRNRGCVWVANDRGVSKIALGYASPVSGGEAPVVVYPNPYSFRRHSKVHFRNIPGDAVVNVYSLNGNLVGKPSEVMGNESRSLFEWKPASRCVPGTYFYSIVTPTSKKTGTMLLVP